MVCFRFSHLKAQDPRIPFDNIYRIDLAITDERGGRFSPLVSYILPSSPGVRLTGGHLNVRMPGPSGSLAMAALPGPGLAYRFRSSLPAGTVDLTARTNRAPLLENGGIVPMGVGGSSYYYSLTNLEAAGTLTLGHARHAVSGLVWMDHQWGSWNWATIRGWDWMAIQLANGVSLSLANFTGGARHPAKVASISYPDGRQRVVAAVMSPLARTWRSPDGTVYPLDWRVRVPAIGLDTVVRATVPGQEMVDQLLAESTYWEGSGRLSGMLAGRPISGLTFTELTGYGAHSAVGL
jgi:predicted secreted hydrolase